MTSIEIRTLGTENQLNETEAALTMPSPGYFEALDIITTGIAQSEANGYKELKVMVPSGSDETTPESMTLAQFFGGNTLWNMVTAEEFQQLFDRYGRQSETHAEARTPKKIGTPVVRIAYESGTHAYLDAKSAAGNDFLDD